MDVSQAVRLRRSVKPEHMKRDPIDRPLIDAMLEAARWAPTHGLTEPWRFVAFEEDGRRALADAVLETMHDPSGAPLAADDPRRASVHAKMLKPPLVLAIICAPSTNPKIVEHEELLSVGMAVQNMMLVARAAGVATYWTSGKKAFHPKMAEFLGLEPPARCLGFLYAGYPEQPWAEGERSPIEGKVIWRR